MAELQFRMERHWLACMASLGGGGVVTRLKGALVVSNPQVSGMALNFISLWEAEPEALPAILDAGSALLAGADRPPALFLSPAAGDMDALGRVLTCLGWRMMGRQSALLCDLAEGNWVASADVQVDLIGPAQLELWGSMLVRCYEASPAAGLKVRAGWTSLMRQPGEGGQALFYLARLDGTPVGTALSWSQGEFAGFYCGAVLPEYRRRGVERAMLTRRLIDARQAGRRYAVLQTAEQSPVEHCCITHLGFRRVYLRELWVPQIQGCGCPDGPSVIRTL